MKGKTRVAHGTIVAYLALFVALGGTSAYAVDKIGSGGIKKNAIKTRHIAAGQVKAADIGRGAVHGGKVANNSLTGADVNEAAFGFGLGLLRGRTPGPDPASPRYVAPLGTTTATFITPAEAGRLSPLVPARAADLAVSAVVAAGTEVTVTLMVDGVASSLGCTIDGPDTTCTDEEDTPALPPGSSVAVRIQDNGAPPTDVEFSLTVLRILG